MVKSFVKQIVLFYKWLLLSDISLHEIERAVLKEVKVKGI